MHDGRLLAVKRAHKPVDARADVSNAGKLFAKTCGQHYDTHPILRIQEKPARAGYSNTGLEEHAAIALHILDGIGKAPQRTHWCH